MRWLRTFGGDRTVRLGKFNPGQKLNATFIGASAVILAATGSIMKWNQPFSTDLRTGADFVHGWFALFVGISVFGHIVMALRDREALAGMVGGTVSSTWARDHRPAWFAETPCHRRRRRRRRGRGFARRIRTGRRLGSAHGCRPQAHRPAARAPTRPTAGSARDRRRSGSRRSPRSLARAGDYLGTSHRQATVKSVVGRARAGLADLFSLPDGYEILLGNGGTTSFWDAATFGLVDTRTQHLVCGEFSSKFAAATKAAPFLADPEVIESPPGTHPGPAGERGGRRVLLAAERDLHRRDAAGRSGPTARPTTSSCSWTRPPAPAACGSIRRRSTSTTSPRRRASAATAASGWPRSRRRRSRGIERLAASDRWIPSSLDLGIALEQSRLDQTYNTPALATLFLLADQVDWMLGHGGLEWAAGRCDRSAEILYGWAEASAVADPYVAKPDERSHVVGTIDFVDTVDAAAIAAALRANGIVDTEPYRKLGRNQLRIAMFPAVEPDDVATLTRAIDYVVGELAA